MPAFSANFSIDANTDWTLNVWSPLPSGSGYVDFTGCIAEFLAAQTLLTGVKTTVLDILSNSSSSAGTVTLGATTLTVYDTSSQPNITLTIPANQWWSIHLLPATTKSFASLELCYNFNVTFPGTPTNTLRPITGSLNFSDYVVPLS